MHFIDFVTGGLSSQMFISSTDKPTLKPNQVLIKVQAFGVNRADTLQRQGKYPPPANESEILGLEVSGVIVDVGPLVKDWANGQRVFGLVAGGGYAEYVAVDHRHILPVPDSMSLNDAAGLAEVFLTAYQSLILLGGLKENQSVLIHAGASSVGLAAIQLANLHHCKIAVTSSSQQKLDICKDFGAKVAINYHTQSFDDVIKHELKGVDLILDFVGGEYLNRNLKCLNVDGKIVYLAMLAGRNSQVDMALLLGKRASILGSTLRNRSDEYKAKLIQDFGMTYLPLFDSKELQVNVDTFYAAKNIGAAHQRVEDNQTKGKLIGVW